MRIFDQWADGVDALLELAAPRQCGGCRLRHQRWCTDCAAALTALMGAPALGWVEGPSAVLPAVWTHAVYESVLTSCLPAYKDDDRIDLLLPLAAALRRAVAGALEHSPRLESEIVDDNLLVVCAPSSAASVRLRGRWPLLDLTRQALSGSRLRIAQPSQLRFARTVADQAGLDAEARAANLDGAMRARGVRDASCLLVDDVMTTGATLAEGARALTAAGAAQVVAVTLAAVTRTYP